MIIVSTGKRYRIPWRDPGQSATDFFKAKGLPVPASLEGARVFQTEVKTAPSLPTSKAR